MPAMMRGGVNRNLVVSIVLVFVTCGIYGLYWIYKLNDEITALSGEPGTSGIMFLVIGLFGLGIVNLALIQDTENHIVG